MAVSTILTEGPPGGRIPFFVVDIRHGLSLELDVSAFAEASGSFVGDWSEALCSIEGKPVH